MGGEDGFYYHCLWQFENITTSKMVFEAVHRAFDWLPLADIISHKALVVHGGIGNGSWGLADLQGVHRPLRNLEGQPQYIIDALWSDPSDSDGIMWKGVHKNEVRGAEIKLWGPDVTREFCHREHVNLIIRSHQYVKEGYKVMHSGHLITLFSASNYLYGDDQDEPTNDAAILLLAEDVNRHLRVHPKRLPGQPLEKQGFF